MYEHMKILMRVLISYAVNLLGEEIGKLYEVIILNRLALQYTLGDSTHVAMTFNSM
jgi:hypothetical protein